MQTQTTQPLPRYSQYTVRLMAPHVWHTLASATQALWPTFGNHRIYQLQSAETESAPNVVRLLSAETECPPKVPIYPHSAPKPKPKPKFGRPLTMDNWLENTHAPVTFLLSFECNFKTLVNILIWLFYFCACQQLRYVNAIYQGLFIRYTYIGQVPVYALGV